jgi:uncharacterized protein
MSAWHRALVTGASSGIGEAFADELARRRVDLVLVGRDQQALEMVADRARSRGVIAEVVQADLATPDGVARVVGVIRDSVVPIDLLVNNAGFGQWGRFLDLPLDQAIDSVHVNNDALVALTHTAASRMRALGAGAIIQISSMASIAPSPNQAVYGASKAFVSSFGQAMSQEWTESGIGITCTTVLPSLTRTNYFERAGIEINADEKLWMSAAEVAVLSLDAAQRGRPLVIPNTRSRMRIAVATQFPSLAFGRAKRQVRSALLYARDLVLRRSPPAGR